MILRVAFPLYEQQLLSKPTGTSWLQPLIFIVSFMFFLYIHWSIASYENTNLFLFASILFLAIFICWIAFKYLVVGKESNEFLNFKNERQSLYDYINTKVKFQKTNQSAVQKLYCLLLTIPMVLAFVAFLLIEIKSYFNWVGDFGDLFFSKVLQFVLILGLFLLIINLFRISLRQNIALEILSADKNFKLHLKRMRSQETNHGKRPFPNCSISLER